MNMMMAFCVLIGVFYGIVSGNLMRLNVRTVQLAMNVMMKDTRCE